MILISLINLLYDIVLFLLSTIITILSALQRSLQHSRVTVPLPQQLIHLQADRSALVRQQEELSHQIAVLDALIHSLQRSSPSIQILPQQISPPRSRGQTTTRHSRIGTPYPLPFNPPPTPEEERRNRIIAWVNDLRKQNQTPIS